MNFLNEKLCEVTIFYPHFCKMFFSNFLFDCYCRNLPFSVNESFIYYQIAAIAVPQR